MRAVTVLGLALLAACATPEPPAEAPVTGFLDRTIMVAGAEAEYQVYVPREYTEATEWPVILFLHGAGERGDDALLQTHNGLPSWIRREVDRWPAIVVMPQVPEDERWVGRSGDVAMAALDATIAEFAIDTTRTYLTGLSMGGQGSWYLAYEHPERWAAVAVVCGFLGFPGTDWGPFTPEGEDPVAATAARIAELPIWVFHGDADNVVPVDASRVVVAALEELGGDVQYTEFEGVDHNAWDPAYSMPELSEWMFAQRR